MDPWLRRHCTTCSGSIDPNTRIRFDARAREHTKGNVMSETTSEPCENLTSPACPGLGSEGTDLNLVALCDHIVNWVTSFESTLNRVNYAEANCMSEGDVAAANAEEVEALLEIMDLVVTVTDIHATTQIEIEGKKRTLDALTSIPAWERDSLYALRRSIERDQLEVNAALFASRQPSAQRASWLTRFNPGVAKG
jgi:hypothetical protein